MRSGCWLALALLSASSLWAATKPNIVLITLDSTRAERMDFLGGKQRLTPNLDALARQSIVFGRAYAQSPETVASHAALLTGTYPPYNHVSALGGALGAALPYLPALLHAGGYGTAAFVGTLALDPRNGFASGFDRGFDVYDAGFRLPRAGEARYGTVERRGGEVVARALAWLRQPRREPFFLWVELNDAHAPAPGYDGGIRYDDAQAGKLLRELRARKLYEGALIVVAGDHGESLGAHGEQRHGVFLYDETIRVPLLLKLPRGRAGRTAARVRLVDVAGTVLQAAGLAAPPQMQGQSLLRAMREAGGGDAAYASSEFSHQAFGWSALEAWRAGKYLYVRAPRPELYDLQADPGAGRNLAESAPATAQTMAAQLAAFDRRMAGTAAGAAQLSFGELQKLASLGYVGLQKPLSPQAAAVGADPKDEIGLANKVEEAWQEIEEGRPQRATAALEAVLKSHPGMFLGQFAAGVARAQRGQYAAAVPFLRQAIELEPQAAWTYYAMGEALARSGEWKGAAAHLEIAVGRLPEMAEAHALLAEAYRHLGRGAEAKKEEQRAAELGKGGGQ